MKNSIFVFLSVLFFFACQKEKPAPIPDPCENAYDLRSKIYENLYTGDLPVCLIANKYIYPEKYSYSRPHLSPNNDYELYYLKKDNQTREYNLYKFNFCTNQTNFIFENLPYGFDLSKKDWLIFVHKSGIWKMKSNGDSLKKIDTPFFYYPTWSPSGSRFFNGKKVFDENGKYIDEIPLPISTFNWETDTTFLCTRTNTSTKSFDIFRFDLSTKKMEVLYTENNNDGAKIHAYNPKYSFLIVSVLEKDNGRLLKINTNTWKSEVIWYYVKHQVPILNNLIKDKLLGEISIIDTLTGIPCSINYRTHIAIMNLDGTNKRQVLLPE